MSGQLTVTSTTDSAQSVNAAAAAVEGDVLVTPAENDARPASKSDGEYITPTNSESVGRGGVASTTDTPEQVREAAEDLREERADREEEYLGRGKRERKFRRQISRLVAQRWQRDETIEDLQQRLAAYEGSQTTATNGEAAGAPADSQQPQQQPPNKLQADIELRREVEAAQARIPELEKGIEARYPDYAESTAKCGKEFPISPQTYLHMVLHLPNPPDVAYFLSKHPEVVSRLWSLEAQGPQGAMQAMQELNDISGAIRYHDKIDKSAPARRQQTYSAPPPIKPVGGASAARAPRIDDPNLDYQTYKRMRDEEERRGR
jgi:hypothetical protein